MTQVSSRTSDSKNCVADRNTRSSLAAETPCKPELAALVTRAQGGCASAFTDLTQHFRPRLLRFLEAKFPTDRADAEDVVQESLTKAWQNLSSYRSGHAFSTWLYTIAYRTAIDFVRVRRKLPAESLSPAEESSRRLDLADPNSGATSNSLEVAEEARNIWAAAKAVLDESHFAVLWLRYAEELSIAEVAQVLRKTKVSVRVSLHRAKAKVRNHKQSTQHASKRDGHSPANSEQESSL